MNNARGTLWRRDRALVKSVLVNMASKPAGMVLSVLYTPLLLAYLGEVQYGVWATILSVISWINYFDAGIGNGLRNVLTKKLGAGDAAGAQKANSTAYTALSGISLLILALLAAGITLFDMGAVFNTPLPVDAVLYISVAFICLNFILSLCKIQLYALERSQFVSIMGVVIQALNLAGIACLYWFTDASLVFVAALTGITTALVNIGFSAALWVKNNILIPRLRSFDRQYLKDICKIGLQFFFIQLSYLVLFTSDNLIITNLFGPARVTPYNTVHTAFGIVNTMFSAMMIPLWSRYTLAAEKNDFHWIKSTVRKLNYMVIPLGAVLLAGVLFYQDIAAVWLHKTLVYDDGLILCMGVYFLLMVYSSIYSTLLNGLGIVNVQMVCSVISAVINIPLSIFFAGPCGMGSTGVILATVLCLAASTVAVRLQVAGIFRKSGGGIGRP